MYIPNQDQNVIQHTALIFLGRWSVVLSIIESMVIAPDCFRRDLSPVSSANLSPIQRNLLTYEKAIRVLLRKSRSR